MIQEKVHVTPVRIDFDLLDAGNVVYHPNYLILCDRARAQAFDDAGYPAHEMWKDGVALALVETLTHYKSPAMMGQNLAIATRLLDFQRVSLFVEQKLFLTEQTIKSGYLEEWDDSQAKKILFDAKIKLVCVSVNPLKVTAFPSRLASALMLNS